MWKIYYSLVGENMLVNNKNVYSKSLRTVQIQSLGWSYGIAVVMETEGISL